MPGPSIKGDIHVRIILIIVVALFALAVAAFAVDPTSGPLATQFMTTYLMPPIAWVVQKTGFSVSDHGLYLIVALGVAAFIMINGVFSRLSDMRRDRDRAQDALDDDARASFTELLANMSFRQRLGLVETQSDVLRRELERFKEADEEESDWRDRIEAIGEAIEKVRSREDEHLATAKFSGVIADIESYVNASSERLKRAAESVSPEHLQELNGAVTQVSERLDDLREGAEPLGRILQSARDIDKQVAQHILGEGGIAAQLREVERLRDRLRTRLDELHSNDRDSIDSRMSTLASEISRLERSFDELDIDSRRERVNEFDTRLSALRAQLSMPAALKVAAA